MNTIRYSISALLILSLAALQAQQRGNREANITVEDRMRVEIRGAHGSIVVAKAGAGKAYSVRFERTDEDAVDDAVVSYRIENGTGYLRIVLDGEYDEDDDDISIGIESLGTLFQDNDDRRYRVELSDKVPIDFSFKFGAGEARLDFTDMMLTGLNMEAGASSIRMKMLSENPEIMHLMKISAGMGSIRSERLGNFNFERFDFEGGLGSYKLDFTGALRDGARISTEIGLGSLELCLPEGVGARAYNSDSFLSSCSLQKFNRTNGSRYESVDYRKARKRVVLDLNSGLGSVAVKWR